MKIHLTDYDVELAVKLLEGWNEKITWERFLSVFKKATGKKITKQAVHKGHPKIVDAFNNAKIRHRKNRQIQQALTGKFPTEDESNTVLSLKINKLIEELETLRSENHNLMKQCLRWQYNAHAHGITKEMLNKPMPSEKSGKNKSPKKSRAKNS